MTRYPVAHTHQVCTGRKAGPTSSSSPSAAGPLVIEVELLQLAYGSYAKVVVSGRDVGVSNTARGLGFRRIAPILFEDCVGTQRLSILENEIGCDLTLHFLQSLGDEFLERLVGEVIKTRRLEQHESSRPGRTPPLAKPQRGTHRLERVDCSEPRAE